MQYSHVVIVLENGLERRNRLTAEIAKKGCFVKEIQRLLVNIIGIDLGLVTVHCLLCDYYDVSIVLGRFKEY